MPLARERSRPAVHRALGRERRRGDPNTAWRGPRGLCRDRVCTPRLRRIASEAGGLAQTLWESPEEIGKTEFMQVSKALSILDKVGQMKAYDMDAEVKFEYSNANFHTAQLFVTGFSIKNGNLLMKLDVNPTDCKAKETCGVAEPAMESANECAPGGGCC